MKRENKLTRLRIVHTKISENKNKCIHIHFGNTESIYYVLGTISVQKIEQRTEQGEIPALVELMCLYVRSFIT